MQLVWPCLNSRILQITKLQKRCTTHTIYILTFLQKNELKQKLTNKVEGKETVLDNSKKNRYNDVI